MLDASGENAALPARFKYLIHVEGLNLGSIVFDTQDLRTIRGGSHLLLRAVRELPAAVSGLTAISTGASVGLYGFDGDDPDAVVKDIRAVLAQPPFSFATFGVACLPWSADESFATIRRLLQDDIRRGQLAAPTRSLAGVFDGGDGLCAVDGLLPVAATAAVAGEPQTVSAPVKARREVDQNLMKDLGLGDYSLVGSLDDLAVYEDTDKQVILDRHYAVLYMDGNGFGKYQRNLQTPGELAAFDADVQGVRSAMLQAVCEFLDVHPDGKNGGKLRLAPLLWGGDEFLFVVPAGLGWQVAGLVFEKLGKLNRENRLESRSGHRLTHGAGMVFANHKLNIHEAKRMAEALAEECKNVSRGDDLIAYHVLGSAFVSADAFAAEAGVRAGWTAHVQKRAQLCLPGGGLADTLGKLADVRDKLSRAAVRELAETPDLSAATCAATTPAEKAAAKRLTDAAETARKLVQDSAVSGYDVQSLAYHAEEMRRVLP